MAAGSGRSTRGCPRRSFCCCTVTQGCACSLRALALCDGHSTVQRYLGRGHRRRRLLAPCHAVLRLELQRLHGGLELRLGLPERLGADLLHRHLCGGSCAVCQREPTSRGHRSRSHVAIALGTGGGIGGVQDLAVAGGEHGTALGTHSYSAVPGKAQQHGTVHACKAGRDASAIPVRTAPRTGRLGRPSTPCSVGRNLQAPAVAAAEARSPPASPGRSQSSTSPCYRPWDGHHHWRIHAHTHITRASVPTPSDAYHTTPHHLPEAGILQRFSVPVVVG